MIVIGLLGILASLALPSYFSYVARGHAAQLVLDVDEFRTKLATAKATGGLEPNCDWRLAIDPARLAYRYADLSISSSGSAVTLSVWSVSTKHGKMGPVVAREAFHVLDRAGLISSKPLLDQVFSAFIVELLRPVDCSASPDSKPPVQLQGTGAGQSSPAVGAGSAPGAGTNGNGPGTQPGATGKPPGQVGNPVNQGQSVGTGSTGSQGATGKPPGQVGNPANQGQSVGTGSTGSQGATGKPPGQVGNPANQGQSVGTGSTGSQGTTGKPPGQTGPSGGSNPPASSHHQGGGGGGRH